MKHILILSICFIVFGNCSSPNSPKNEEKIIKWPGDSGLELDSVYCVAGGDWADSAQNGPVLFNIRNWTVSVYPPCILIVPSKTLINATFVACLPCDTIPEYQPIYLVRTITSSPNVIWNFYN